ncbi:MAG: DUF5626 family protein [Oscillospiraceae bacterium]|nr:DUF5626 family protein [Oscillospiraceae bacterium]
MSKFVKRALSVILTAMIAFSVSPSVLAAEYQPEVVLTENHAAFFNISQMEIGERAQYTVSEPDGGVATIGIEKISGQTRAGGETWRVWYKGIGADVEFYMTVSNNRVTSIYDYSISLFASTYEDAELTKTSTYGKLTFTCNSVAGIASSTCWLKGTVTGESDDIEVTWQM